MDEVDKLIRQLKDPDSEFRLKAARELGDKKDARAIPALLEALKDDDGYVRWAAVVALEEIGKPAVPALIESLKDENVRVQWGAAEALGGVDGSGVLPALIGALKDRRAKVRLYAANALGYKNDARAVSALIEALRDEDPDVQVKAAEALVRLASEMDVDLSEISKSLGAHIKSVEKKGCPEKIEERGWALETYKEIAGAVSERRQKDMGELKVPFKRATATGKKMYRMRRAVNG